MAGANIDGLVSGLDTSTLIRQLMQAERQPQLRLSARKDAHQKSIDALTAMITKIKAARDAAGALRNSADWQLRTATSSDDKVAVATASSGTSKANLSFIVQRLASTHSVLSNDAVASVDAQLVAPDTEITVGTKTIDVGTGKLSDVVAKVNAADAGVTATALQVAPSQWKLLLTATSTGAASAFTVEGLDTSVVTQGQNAMLVLGTDPAGPHTIESATNTFTGLADGLTVTVRSTSTTPVTISMATDAEALADKVQALVTAVNDASSAMRSQSTWDPATRQGGPLAGESTIRTLDGRLRTALGSVAIGGLTAASVGISIDRQGTVTFDRAQFLKTFGDQPNEVAALFLDATSGTEGIAEQVHAVTDGATDFTSGSLTLVVNARKDGLRTLDDQIAAWDTRLALREAALRRQFSNLESTLGRLRDQSNWLAGQINSLMG